MGFFFSDKKNKKIKIANIPTKLKIKHEIFKEGVGWKNAAPPIFPSFIIIIIIITSVLILFITVENSV